MKASVSTRRIAERATIDDVRRVVLEPERERIAQLEARPHVTPSSVADVLPAAVAESTGRGDALAVAFEPTMTAAVRNTARREPELFGEILAPSIGAAVRRAVADAFAALQQRLDEALERGLSIESLRWRLEAWRTGRPFAEVVLLRSLVYRVEQVFLIHTESGLLLQHVAAEPDARADQVASMLSAIDSFAGEAFRSGSTETHLRKVQLDELTVWVERDPVITLAAVVRGVAPASLGDALREARERVRFAQRAELRAFEHDVTPFAATTPILERLLCSARKPPRRRAHVLMAAAAVVLALLAALWLVHRAIDGRREASERAAYVEALEAAPGIVVTSIEPVDGSWRVAGFADPLAPAPADLVARAGLAPADLRFEPFYSMDPRLLRGRIERALDPPPGVRLSFARGILRATGTAPLQWAEQAARLAPVLPGVEGYQDETLEVRAGPP